MILPLDPVLGRNPELIPISNSEIGTFKDCKRKWWLNYYLGLGPKDRKTTGALAFGTRVHAALEELYKNGQDPLVVWADLIEKEREIAIEAGLITDDLDKEAELGRIMLEGYMEWLEEEGIDSNLEVTDTEKSLSAIILDGRVELRGKIDLRVKRKTDGARMALDFKTVMQYETYTKIAHMAEQLKMYQLLESLNNEDEKDRIAGGRYRLLKKVKRSARATPPFYKDFEVKHNKTTLKNFWASLHGVVQDMVTLRDQLDAGADPIQVAYPSPSNDCTWKCPFYTACPMFDDGSAVVDYVEDNFVQYDPYERYNETEEE